MNKGRIQTARNVIWILLLIVIMSIGAMSSFLFSTQRTQTPITTDYYMTTTQYHTDIEIGADHSYQVKENLSVVFDTPRHGIYRYIPQKGIITTVTPEGKLQEAPYYATFKQETCSDPVDIYSENSNRVFQIGSEDTTISGAKEYQLSYTITPVMNTGYTDAYYNVFPTGWQNDIPAGSTFTIAFPKELDHSLLRFYYGVYGEQKDGAQIVDLSWKDHTVIGVLKEALPVGSGLTFYMPLPEGYFQNVHTVWEFNKPYIIVGTVILVIILALFLLFGRDSTIIPSVQFTPPQGLDSAAVGCIIDGSVSNEDLMSLFLYWADKGYLKIRETKSHTLAFTKLQELPEDTPRYARIIFDKVFGKGINSLDKEVKVSSLKYKMADTFASAKQLLDKEYQKQLYTAPSKVARVISFSLAVIPAIYFIVLLYTVASPNFIIAVFMVSYIIGLLMFCMTVDFWYSKTRASRMLLGSVGAVMCIVPWLVLIPVYGIPMLKGDMLNLFPVLICGSVVEIISMILVGFMKKRTAQCIEWMGYLAGLRDFIETAELERMKVMAEESPHLFYHILPFAYVFGLSDILLDKMRDLTIPAPEWYESPSHTPYFDYYLMHRMLHTGMPAATTTISTPKPAESSSKGGGFSGGGFSGGGFSGGGFGGGGGGSW